MRLYIAEKPSLGRAIAAALPQPQRKGTGCIYVGNGDCVSWCIGHLLEQAEPHAYDPAYKQWNLEQLPIIPHRWQLKPRPKTRSQLGVLKKLIAQAGQLVHAGDPDREGQLLVDEVIDYLKVPPAKRQTMQRCLISDLNPSAVRRALDNLRDNQEFVPLSTSALARSRADWLYGINMTRACTVQGRKVGFRGLLSVGRVQTPVLGLVVARDLAIEQFVSKPFYEVLAHVETAAGERFTAKWRPSEACQPYQDEEGRILSRSLAVHVVQRIAGQPARVDAVDEKPRRQPPPLPYNLSALQIEGARRHGLSAQQVLECCQNLYEKHKLITYPRSDCRYLPREHLPQAPGVAAAIAAQEPALADPVQAADFALKSQAWNDQKVGAHHAIIPTQRQGSRLKLSQGEKQIYDLIARQYLAQFYPAHRFLEVRARLTIDGGVFETQERRILEPGWKVLFPREARPQDAPETPSPRLPALAPGQVHHCHQGELLEKQTQPPKPFTDATLMAAMTGIGRFVTDPEVRRILKETDGLGTEATRAGILELLFKRQYLHRQGKTIRATEAGRGLIASLPEEVTRPDMTARWEAQLETIGQRQASYQSFMAPLIQQLEGLVAEAGQQLPTALRGVKSRPPRRRSGKRGARAAGQTKKISA